MPAWAIQITDPDLEAVWFDPLDKARHLRTEERVTLSQVIARGQRALEHSNSITVQFVAGKLTRIGARVQPGLNGEAATAWAASLAQSLSFIPGDLLEAAVAKAQFQQFEFLNQIGLWIEQESREGIARRRLIINRLREIDLKARSLPSPRGDRRNVDPSEADDLNRAMEAVGASLRYRPDGSEYRVEPGAATEMRKPTGPARMPTADDYVSLGMSPEDAQAAVDAHRPVKRGRAA